jgi:RDD family protein
LSGSDRTPQFPTPESALVDLPLGPSQGVPSPSAERPEGIPTRAASLSARATAGAADAAAVLCTTAAALLFASRVTGQAVGWNAIGWAAAFALYLSLFVTVVPLFFFGKTPGMSLAGLCAQPSPSGRRLTAGEAALRWLGTLLTGVSFGLAVLWSAVRADGQTVADRLSGRPLVEDGEWEL